MPNWCKGVWKIRGKQEDVFNLLKENLAVYKTVIVKEPEFDIFEVKDDEGIVIDNECFEITLKKDAYINGTHRNFCINGYINVWGRDNGTSCVAIDFKAAWGIDSEPYLDMAKKYNVDIKIEAFEKGMEFSQYILIEDGKLKKDKEIRYDDYVWDCVMPNLGG